MSPCIFNMNSLCVSILDRLYALLVSITVADSELYSISLS